MAVLRIEQRRGFALEAVHAVDAMVCDTEGRVLAQIGDDFVTTFRSAAKPFQLEVSLELLPEAARAALEGADLALGAASHHGEAAHVVRVRSLLARLGREARHLHCGVHAPVHAKSAEALFASGERPTVLHNNCSGKHTFMAAACAAQGYAEDYLSPDHPLQRRILERLAEHAGGSVRGAVTDGCGVPCSVLPLSGMARAWAELAKDVADEPESTLGRIGRAMREHPRMMSGSDAFDGWLIEHAPLIAKVGAQGLLCLGLPAERVGIAIKVRTGSDVVRPAAALAVLERAFPGIVQAEVPDRFTRVFNLAGLRVGEHAAMFG